MTQKRKRLYAAAAALALAAVLFAVLFSIWSQPKTITIFHTNDVHGRFVGDDESIIGIDRIAAIQKSVPGALLFDAGDALHGLPIATLSRGEDAVRLMGAAGYDAMAAGNHDFNYGWKRLQELQREAPFAIIASNVWQDGNVLGDKLLFEVDGVRVGVFGLITEQTGILSLPDNTAGLKFLDPIATAKERVASLKSDLHADIVIALCHLGDEENSATTSLELAQQLPEIDLIIDGHSHTTLENGLVENGVLIVQAGQYENALGRVDITVRRGKAVEKSASLISFEAAQAYEPDPQVASLLAEISESQQELLKKPVGASTQAMSSERAPGVRTQEMPLGSLVADAYREAAGAQIAIANGGDIRADLPAGTVTKGDIISILPFGNTLQVKRVSPTVLKEVLENGVSYIALNAQGEIDPESSANGRFPQVSGFQFTYDPTLPPGQRITSITLENGKSLDLADRQTKLTLAGSNFIMTGGDEYTMLASLPVYQELGAADEALSNYIAKHSPVTLPYPGRILSVLDAVFVNAAA